MLIMILILATALMGAWLFLLHGISREDWSAAATNKVLDNRDKIDELKRKDAADRKKLAQYHGISAKVMGLLIGSGHDKEIGKLTAQNTALQSGDLRSVLLLIMPGYVLQRRFSAIGRGAIHKELLQKSAELYGKKYAHIRARHLLAQLLSFPIIGVSVALMLGVIMTVTQDILKGLLVGGIGSVLALVVTYAMYDELTDRLNKRHAAIVRQFPNVVSKLALLVTSGMPLERAWRQTAESEEKELYQEMKKTSEEMDNLVDAVTAFSNFIDRCNTKETTKLASALIQSQTKGNAEIGVLLKNMAQEAWLERRHTAKRDSEAANSKLMIPTMLLFGAILIMILVPVVMNFTSMA